MNGAHGDVQVVGTDTSCLEEQWAASAAPVMMPLAATAVVDAEVGPGPSLLNRGAKRGFDLLVTTVALIVLFPALLVSAILVKASGLPIFFTQERVGRNGKLFKVYKFDTMRRAPFQLCVSWEDDRVTRVGRWMRTMRIDELPQLWNIIRGDMSLVGPRPLPLDVVEAARHRTDYAARELVRPGLAGWAKLRDPNSHFSLDPGMLVDDVFYARHANVWFDLRIIALTPLAVWRGLGHFRASTDDAPTAAPVAEAATS